MTLEFDQNKVSRGQKVILVQQRKQAKIGFETFCSKYIPKTFTPGGQLQAASPVTVCQWVKESWQELSKEMVERSFKKCGISNALDGTEDDLVWEEEEDSSQVEEEPDCDVYDDRITPEQWQELFGESDDEEEFHGF